jgi:hypothetical protein
MSGLLGSIFGTLGNLFGNFFLFGVMNHRIILLLHLMVLVIMTWSMNEVSDDTSDSSSEYDTADKGENDGNEEDSTITFRLIEDPVPKRLIEASRVGNNSLCRDYVANIPEKYPHRRDPLLMFEDIEKQISEIYNAEIQRLGGIKTKIVLIAHMINNPDENEEKEADIAFPSEIIGITWQDRIDEYISQQYHLLLDRIEEMEQNAHSGWIYMNMERKYISKLVHTNHCEVVLILRFLSPGLIHNLALLT